MEIRFCPQCGVARQGAFCGGCGFQFESLSSIAVAGPRERVLPREDAPGRPPSVGAVELKQPSFPIPFGMTYGETFDQAHDCWNCGAEAEFGTCGLCGFSRA